MGRFKYVAFSAAALCAFLSIAAKPAAAEKILAANYGSASATLPWVVAFTKNMFKDEGLQIEEVVSGAGGGTSLRTMLAGELPFAVVTTQAALAAIKSGIPLKIICSASNHVGETALVALAGKNIRTIKDLVGKKVGYASPRSMTEMVTRMVVKRNGLDKVELISTGGFGPGLTALNVGGVDAVTLIDPPLTLQAERFKVIVSYSEQVPRMTWLVGVTTPQVIATQPEKLRALIRVQRRAVDYMFANPGDTAAIYTKVWEKDRAQVERLLPRYFKMKGLWTRGEFDKEGLEVMSNGLQAIGEADKPVDWKAIIDQRFLPPDAQKPL